MKLPIKVQSPEEMYSEFDFWITVSMGEIRDTERFQREMDAITSTLDLIGAGTNNFAKVEDCNRILQGSIIEKPELQQRVLQCIRSV